MSHIGGWRHGLQVFALRRYPSRIGHRSAERTANVADAEGVAASAGAITTAAYATVSTAATIGGHCAAIFDSETLSWKCSQTADRGEAREKRSVYVRAGQSLRVDRRASRLSWQNGGDLQALLRIRLALRRRGGRISLDEFSGLGCDFGVRASVLPLVLFGRQRGKSFQLKNISNTNSIFTFVLLCYFCKL